MAQDTGSRKVLRASRAGDQAKDRVRGKSPDREILYRQVRTRDRGDVWNANVFFELGVRCSLSRKTTILTTQEERPLPFDISPMNCVRYANGLEAPQKAAEAIAQIVHDERGTNAVRSLVRAFTEVEVVPQERWKILSGERIKTLLAAAKDAADPKQKLAHINEAVDIDPLSEAARIAQAGTLRAARQFDQALSATEIALKIFRNSARLYKEKGLILDKMSMDQIDKLDEAAQALQQALRFDSTDHDLHCCYGGVLRRRGLRPGNPERDRDLTASLLHYREGLKLDRHSSYAGLNELRLRLLMPNASNGQAGDMTAALKRMYYLCEFEVTHSQIANDAHRWWRMFDLADVHAFDEKQDEALSTYESAIKLIPELDRVDVLVSPFRVWKELLEADLLRKSIRTNAELILDLLKRNIA